MQNDPFPHEFVPKVRPGDSTDEYLYGYNSEFPAVQIKFHRSIWFNSHARDNFISPDQTLILTSFEENEELVGREPEDELERLQELEEIVDVYFPGDRWVIDCDEMDRRELLSEIERSVEGQKAIKRMVKDANVDVALYPIIVGWEPWHYEHCRELFEVFDTRSCAFDGTEYDSKYRLWEDLEALIETLEPKRIYLNGRISVEQLHDVPDEVVAFSGKKTILEEIELPDGSHSRKLLIKAVDKRIDAMHNTQTVLNEFIH